MISKSGKTPGWEGSLPLYSRSFPSCFSALEFKTKNIYRPYTVNSSGHAGVGHDHYHWRISGGLGSVAALLTPHKIKILNSHLLFVSRKGATRSKDSLSFLFTCLLACLSANPFVFWPPKIPLLIIRHWWLIPVDIPPCTLYWMLISLTDWRYIRWSCLQYTAIVDHCTAAAGHWGIVCLFWRSSRSPRHACVSIFRFAFASSNLFEIY